jgi:hypothetical protein
VLAIEEESIHGSMAGRLNKFPIGCRSISRMTNPCASLTKAYIKLSTFRGAALRISMDGKARWIDNVFMERLWRNVKYEEVYLKAYDSIGAARASLGQYFACCPNYGIHFLIGPQLIT